MSNVRRLVLATATVLMALAANGGVAEAGWVRGLSSLGQRSDDVKVCADEITISSSYDWQVDAFEVNFPTFVPVVGAAYPAAPGEPGSPDKVELFGSAADAVAGVNAVATVEIALTQESIGVFAAGTRHIFTGRATIPTPAGYRTGGAKLYVQVFNGFTVPDTAVLTVGGPSTIGESYGCAPTVTPLPFGISLIRDRVPVPSRYPSLIWFDPTGVDLSTVRLAANNGAPTPARYLGTYSGRAFALVSLARAGVNCATTSLNLTARGTSGQSFAGSRAVRPFGRC